MWKAIAIGSFVFLNIISTPICMNYIGNIGYPGEQSRDIEDLHPNFRKKLSKVISRMEKEGYPIFIGSTWRDAERQAFYVEKGYSKIMDSLHRGGKEEKGQRKAQAADLLLQRPMIYLPLHTNFFKRLQEVAQEEGLCTGAGFKKSNPLWAIFDLGWDPGHVQIKTKYCP